MTRRILVLLGCLWWTAAAWSKGTIHVVTDVPAEVLLDGQSVGDSPVTLHNIPKGQHEIRIVTRNTHETRVIPLYIPGHVFISKEFALTFQHPAAPPVVAPPPVLAGPAVGPVGAGGFPTAVAPPPPAPVVMTAAPNRNKLMRRRIIAAAVTVIGILTHADIITGLGLGGGIMNEVIHHDAQDSR